MSTTVIIDSREDLIAEVLRQIEPSGGDFSGTMIVFPGKRPAHFVRKRIGSVLQKSFIPPQIVSIDDFVQRLCAAGSGSESLPQLSDIDAVAVLYEIHLKIEHPIGGGQFRSLDDFFAVGIKLYSELEELKLTGHDTQYIQKTIEGLPAGRLQSLGAYYKAFYEEIRRRAFTTRALQYLGAVEAVESGAWPDVRKLVVAGFFALTKTETKLFSLLRKREDTAFVFQKAADEEQPWKDFEPASEEKSAPEPVPAPVVTFTKSSDVHGQVFALAQELKEKRDTGIAADEKTVIVLPDPESLFPLLHHALPPFKEEEYNIALGYPLSRTPIFGFLQDILALAAASPDGMYPASLYMRFVLHPYVKNIRFEQRADVTRILFHEIEKHLARETNLGSIRLEELEERNKIFTAAADALSGDGAVIDFRDLQKHLKNIHDRTIRPLRFTPETTIGSFASVLIELLNFVYDASTANAHPFFRRYAERMLETLDGVSRSLLAGLKFQEPSGYLNFIQTYIAAVDVPFAGTPLNGLQVLGLLETRSIRFETVYIMDVNEGVLPGAQGQDMMLPQKLRRLLGMETYRDREKLTEHYFRILLQGAKEVHLFFTESRSGQKERSRFIQKMLWRGEREAEKLIGDTDVRTVRYKVHLTAGKPEKISKTPQIMDTIGKLQFSATSLDAYLRCGLKFYYASVLRLREKQEVDEEIDNRDIGDVVHRVLHEVIRPMMNTRLTPAALAAVDLKFIIEEQFRQYFGDARGPREFLLQGQVLKQMQAFVERYQIPLAEKEQIVVLGAEDALQASIRKTAFSVRTDRIEQRGEKIVVLDYKISNSADRYGIKFSKLNPEDRATWPEAIGSLQLPLYIMIYSTLRNIPPEKISAAYLLLGKRTIDASIESPLYYDTEEAREWQGTVENIIFSLVDEIRNPAVDFSLTADFMKQCPGCPFQGICGTQWTGNGAW
jgi:CRISPR/Cas system-associated exonuclease Cas4 (RecB family)